MLIYLLRVCREAPVKFSFVLVSAGLALPTAQTHAQQLPAEVTPGGILPGIEQTAPIPENDDPSGTALPEAELIDVLPLQETETFQLQAVSLDGAINRSKSIKLEELQSMIDSEMQEAGGTWSVDRLNRLAAQITNYYRQRDYFLTRALVLEQPLDDGSAQITVIEGVLGNVEVEGQKHIKPAKIEKVFRAVQGKPTPREKIESALFYAADLAGIAGRGVLKRGAEPGTADLRYQISRDKRWEFYLHGDNYGSEFVGENRLRADVVVNNPLGQGDRFTLSGLTSLNPSNNEYIGFDYSYPAILASGKPLSIGLSGSHNEFVVGGALQEFGIEGESDRLDFYLGLPYKRSALDNRSLSLALSSKSSEVFQNDIRSSLDELTVLTLRHLWNKNYTARGGGAWSVNATYSKGFDDFLGSMEQDASQSSRLGGSGTKAGGDFDKLNWSLNWTHRLNRGLNLRTRFNGQHSDDLLVSLEQFPIGGPNSVRAYPLSAFLMDSGVFASAELIGRINDSIAVSVYGDYADGDLNDPLPADVADIDISGFGIGLTANYKNKFSIIGSAARPNGPVPEGFERDTQLFISLSSSFR